MKSRAWASRANGWARRYGHRFRPASKDAPGCPNVRPGEVPLQCSRCGGFCVRRPEVRSFSSEDPGFFTCRDVRLRSLLGAVLLS